MGSAVKQVEVSRRGTGRTLRRMALLLSIALVMAACSGDGGAESVATDTEEEPGQDQTDDSGTDAEEPPDLGEVTLGFACPCYAWAPYVVAEQAGYLEEEGLTVERVVISGSAAFMAAMTSGDFYVGWSGATDAVGAGAIGEPIRLIGLMVHGVGNVVSVSNDWIEETGVGPDAPLEEKMEALRGATIAAGSPGAGGFIFASNLLEEFGIDPETDVTMTTIGTDAATHSEALQSGTIDVSVLSPPTANLITQAGEGVAYINPLQEELPGNLGSMSNHGMVASVDGLADPESERVIEAVMRATMRGAALIRDEPDEALSLLAQDEWYADLDSDVLQEAFDWFQPATPRDLSIADGFVEASLEILRNEGRDIPEDPPMEDMVDLGPAEAAKEGLDT